MLEAREERQPRRGATGTATCVQRRQGHQPRDVLGKGVSAQTFGGVTVGRDKYWDL